MVTVVDNPEAHQQNLRPPESEVRSIVLALPSLPVCARLAPDFFSERRRAAIDALATTTGGGDGPAPVIDLEDDQRPLDDILTACIGRSLVVFGGDDQPGFARAILFRWDGPLRWIDAAALAPLARDGWLTDDLVVIEANTPVPVGARRVLVRCPGHPRPPPKPIKWAPFAPDSARMGCWRGTLPFGADGACRAAWSPYLSRRDLHCAALGLDPALDARLAVSRRGTSRARIYVVTGLDGAGKSTHADRLADTLRADGHAVAVHKIYRQGGFLKLADELSGRTRRGATLQAFRASRVIKLIDSLRALRDSVQPALDQADVVIFDRYVETHRAAAESQLGWTLDGHPALSGFPIADLRVWLELPAAEAIARLEVRGTRLTADEHAVGLSGYAECFAKMAGADLRLPAADPLSDNAERIAQAASAYPPKRGGQVPKRVQAAVSQARDRPAQITIGPGSNPLGIGVFSLRAVGQADRAAPRFWLEAYAAQLILDLRRDRPIRATIPLWPAVFARIWPDLIMMSELDRMLAPEIEIIGWRAGGEALFDRLAPPTAAARLRAAYADHLPHVAREQGWPLLEIFDG